MNRDHFVDVKFAAQRWYQVDILLDWDSKQVAFFLDGQYQLKVPFYSLMRDDLLKCDSSFVNKLSLYTLTPGVTSSFKDVKVCKELCQFPTPQEDNNDDSSSTNILTVQKLYQGTNKSAYLVDPF